jgi:hypothetical protein
MEGEELNMDLLQGWIWFRTVILKDILQEHENNILYWRGKEIAMQEGFTDLGTIRHFFQKIGLGDLDVERLSNHKIRAVISNSPLSLNPKAATQTIALECGLVTQMIQQVYQRDAEGIARWINEESEPVIEIMISLY